jgi:hypothetical protein
LIVYDEPLRSVDQSGCKTKISARPGAEVNRRIVFANLTTWGSLAAALVLGKRVATGGEFNAAFDDRARRACGGTGCCADWRSTGESYGKVGINARLLDGYAERDGRSLFEGREIEVRPMENSGD